MNRLLSIFLAEDNRADVDLFEEALREHHIRYSLSLAVDGNQATTFVDRLGRTADYPCPDLIVLDLNLPQTSGFELLERVRNHPLCAQTPVVILTSSNAEKDRRRAAELGVSRYFRKPTDLLEFLTLGELVREVAREHGIEGV